jgi:hypothetical protein
MSRLMRLVRNPDRIRERTRCLSPSKSGGFGGAHRFGGLFSRISCAPKRDFPWGRMGTMGARMGARAPPVFRNGGAGPHAPPHIGAAWGRRFSI